MNFLTNKYPLWDNPPGGNKNDYFAKPTGEKRCPKKGEWYLSGAITEAYQAKNDLTGEYYIARIEKRQPCENTSSHDDKFKKKQLNSKPLRQLSNNKIALNNDDAQFLIDVLNEVIIRTKKGNNKYALNVQRIRDKILKDCK